MDTLISILTSIQQTGRLLLGKLEEEDPDLWVIEALYQERARQISFLEKKFKFSPEPADNKAHKVKTLFEELKVLELKLNDQLRRLKKSRLEALKENEKHGRAKVHYMANNGGRKDQSRFIDLKTSG